MFETTRCILICFSLSEPRPSSVVPGKEKDKAESQECVIILADLDLLQLPLEALECFKSNNIFSLSRDFSLQIFYHRFHQERPIGMYCIRRNKCPAPIRQNNMTRFRLMIGALTPVVIEMFQLCGWLFFYS